jgi:membrane-associated phospholipid phosphatase
MGLVQGEMGNRKLRSFITSLRAVDLVLVLVLLGFSILGAVFHSRVARWPSLILANLCTTILFLILNRVQQRMIRRLGRFFLRLLSVSIALLVIYETSLRLTFIIWPVWKDPAIIGLEQALFGVPPTVWLQSFISPGLTEWMMFSYIAYFALYPIVGASLFFRRGEEILEKFLFVLCFNNIFCNLLYLVYPVDNPIAGLGPLHTVPLKGFVFTQASESMRSHMMTAGGGMPSGHVAATTIMLLAAYKHDRRLFYLLLPIAISVILSTVYCRFHYLSDSVMGIPAAFFCWWAAPAVRKAIDRSLAP